VKNGDRHRIIGEPKTLGGDEVEIRCLWPFLWKTRQLGEHAAGSGADTSEHGERSVCVYPEISASDSFFDKADKPG